MNVTQERLIAVAKGEDEGDLLLKNGKVVNVFTGEIQEGNILLVGDTIAGVGDYNTAAVVVDMAGKYVLPGFVDAHVHIESSHLTPSSFGQSVLAKGTTAVVADPHEIVNVLGEDGFAFMVEDAKKSPMDIFYMIPSAVPATAMETSGAIVDSEGVQRLFHQYPEVLGLGEVMNFPGVLFGDKEVLAKIERGQDKILDGHFPLATGKDLNAYAAVGISSDHESVSQQEAKEKISCGMTIFIREGSSAKNLEAIFPLINDNNWSQFCFCVDDINAKDLETYGDILHCIRKAVALGLPPIRGVQIATINPCRHYHLKRRGAIAPGYLGDMVVVEDLRDFEIAAVYKNGQAFAPKESQTPIALGKIQVPAYDNLVFPFETEKKFARVIKALPQELITEEVIVSVADLEKRKDIAKLLVMERHGKNGNMGWGLIEGFGEFDVTIAQTIAHDSHNLLVLGHEEKEMSFAIDALVNQGGGAVITKGTSILASMPLSIGGLMTWKSGKEVARWEEDLMQVVKEAGIALPSLVMTLSFMALPVIPKLKLSDMGLFDVEAFAFTPLFFD